jgi:hypothetical protein
MDSKFGKYSFRPGEEEQLKIKHFDVKMNPREWMARFGYNIVSGDMRVYRYEDKDFEKWIYEAFESLSREGFESLWEEWLTEEEIVRVKNLSENL